MQKFFVLPGNNSGAIRTALSKREGWEDVRISPQLMTFAHAIYL